MIGVGREDAVRQADDGVQVELLEQLLLDAARRRRRRRACRSGTTTAAPAGRAGGRGLPAQLAHDELEEEQRGLGGLLVLGEVALDAALLLAAEGRVGEDDVHAVLVADLGELRGEGVAGIDLRRLEAVQQQVHLAEQVGQRLGLAAEERCGPAAPARSATVLHLLAQVGEGLDEEAAGAAGRVEHGLAEAAGR